MEYALKKNDIYYFKPHVDQIVTIICNQLKRVGSHLASRSHGDVDIVFRLLAIGLEVLDQVISYSPLIRTTDVLTDPYPSPVPFLYTQSMAAALISVHFPRNASIAVC